MTAGGIRHRGEDPNTDLRAGDVDKQAEDSNNRAGGANHSAQTSRVQNRPKQITGRFDEKHRQENMKNLTTWQGAAGGVGWKHVCE